MKSHDSFDEFLEANQVDCSHWPESEEELFEMLAAFDSSDEIGAGHEKRMKFVQRMLNRPVAQTGRQTKQKQFWDVSKNEQDSTVSKSVLYEIVGKAYRRVFDGASTDLVIADPDRNCLFVHECWKLGAPATQRELNKLLMNARKAKRIGKVEGVKRFTIKREKLDEFMFASEAGLRILQEQEHFQNERWITLDDVLCEPSLGSRFFELAKSIVPGYTALEYRWAALSLRKGVNRKLISKNVETPKIEFQELGTSEKIKASCVPSVAGLFWLKSQKTNVYIGHAQNLRTQLEQLLDVQIEKTVKDFNAFTLVDDDPLVFSVAPAGTLREPLKCELVRQQEPRMNFTKRGQSVVAKQPSCPKLKVAG